MLLDILAENQALYIITIFVLGLLVGSFLNVVIFRLPIMLKEEWRKDCTHYLEENYQTIVRVNSSFSLLKPFNLVKPDSTCPDCGHQIRAWENIPVLSYLFLQGKCSSCKTSISLRYPFVEVLSAILVSIVAWKFGFNLSGFMAIVLTWVLLAIAFIDYDTQYIPDQLTLPVLWLGILLNSSNTFTDLTSSVIGAVAGYLVLWSVYHLFKLIMKKEGMGFGDFKLLAMLGAWLGWQFLPAIIIISSLVGSIIGISLILVKNHESSKPIPFGPFLAIAGWIVLLWGNELNTLYTSRFF